MAIGEKAFQKRVQEAENKNLFESHQIIFCQLVFDLTNFFIQRIQLKFFIPKIAHLGLIVLLWTLLII